MKGDGVIKLPGREYWYTDFRWNNKQIRRSTKTGDKVVAQRRAKALYQKLVDGKFGLAETMKFRNDFAPIGKVIEAYKARAKEVVKPKTAGGNVSALKSILKLVHGGDATALKTTVLTGELVSKYEELRAAEIVDLASRLRIRTSIRSTLTQARSVFDPDKAHWYRELKLPNLKDFRERSVEGPGARQPQPLPTEAIEGLRKAAPELAKSSPALYLAFLLFSRLGLRNVEICAARWHWIEERNGCAWMAIIKRPEENFDPNGNEGRVRIEADVLAELERFRELSKDGFIVPAQHATERHEIVNKQHSEWVSKWIKGRSKTSYELRRYAGSLIYEKTKDILKVKEFLRHSSVTTTTKWYAYLLSSAPGLEMGDF